MLRQIRISLKDAERVAIVPDVDHDGEWTRPLQLRLVPTSNPDVVELQVREPEADRTLG